MWGNVHKLQNSMMNTISILPKKWCFVFSTYIKRVYILLFSCEVMSDFFHPMDLQPARLLCPWDFPDKSTGVDCPSLLQGIFLTQGSNLHLLNWQAGSLPWSYLGTGSKFTLPSVLESKANNRESPHSQTAAIHTAESSFWSFTWMDGWMDG